MTAYRLADRRKSLDFELNKTMQAQIKKEDTYKENSNTLFELRNQLMQILLSFNELVKYQISDFSKQLNLEELYSYISAVKESTERIISGLSYDMLKRKYRKKKRISKIIECCKQR